MLNRKFSNNTLFLSKDEPFKIARVAVGKSAGMAVCTYAFPASEMGIPTVGFGNNLDDYLHYMRPDTARAVAAALIQAADVAEFGEKQRGAPPSPEDFNPARDPCNQPENLR
jgi:hypothetical protein